MFKSSSLLCLFFLVVGSNLSKAQQLGEGEALLDPYQTLAQEGRYQPALALAQDLLQALGDSLPALRGQIMGDCALFLDQLNQKEEALAFHQEGLALLQASLGPLHPESVLRLNNLALYYDNLGDWAQSEALFLEVLERAEQILHPRDLDLSAYWHNLANHYRRRGLLEEALPFYSQALQILEGTEEEASEVYIRSLNNLALTYKSLGRYEEALTLYLRAKEATERSQGKEHPSYGVRLNNLAQLYKSMGKYKEALPLLEEALWLAQATLGREHKNYPVYLNNLSSLYFAMGLYDKALEGYQEALTLTEKAYGNTHYEYAIRLNNLGLGYERLGELEKALPLYRQALEIVEHALGKSHAQYATTLSNLGLLYKAQGKAAEALPCFLEALEITEKALGREHPTYGLRLNNLGGAQEILGREDLALQYYEEALALFEGIYGKSHPYVFRTLGNLFPLLERQGEYALSEQYLQEGLPVLRDYLRLGLSFLTEQELMAFLTEWGQWEQHLLKALWDRGEEKAGLLAPLVYDQVLFKKGFLLQSAMLLRQEGILDSTQAKIQSDLLSLRRRMAGARSSRAFDQAQWDRWKEESQALERLWLRALPTEETGPQPWSYADLQARLEQGTAALEFVQRQEGDYGVLVLEREGLPYFRPLGEDLESSRALLLPLLEAWGEQGLHTFYAAPEGEGHLKPLAGLVDAQGNPLGERFAFHTLLSTRDLGRDFRANVAAQKPKAWVLGLEALPFSMQETGLLQSLLEREGWEVAHTLPTKGEASPQLVHLATHGYQEPWAQKGDWDPYEALLYMGLDLGDRRINALELSQMSCKHCQLVVLSACNSGMGGILQDEGVYGLQRAFKIAGARYILVSLKELDDRRTKILMTNFYRYWLQEGEEIPQAFLKAQSLLYKRFKDPEIYTSWVLIE
jgi:tetratricopeptide (TPR) repeat protein